MIALARHLIHCIKWCAVNWVMFHKCLTTNVSWRILIVIHFRIVKVDSLPFCTILVEEPGSYLSFGFWKFKGQLKPWYPPLCLFIPGLPSLSLAPWLFWGCAEKEPLKHFCDTRLVGCQLHSHHATHSINTRANNWKWTWYRNHHIPQIYAAKQFHDLQLFLIWTQAGFY